MTMMLLIYTSWVSSSFTYKFNLWEIATPVCRRINGFKRRCLSIRTGKEFNQAWDKSDWCNQKKKASIWRTIIHRMSTDWLLRHTFITYTNSHPRQWGSLLQNWRKSIDQIYMKALNRRHGINSLTICNPDILLPLLLLAVIVAMPLMPHSRRALPIINVFHFYSKCHYSLILSPWRLYRLRT